MPKKIEIVFTPEISHAIYVGAPVNWENTPESKLAEINLCEMADWDENQLRREFAALMTVEN